jgi:translocation protein SEC63
VLGLGWVALLFSVYQVASGASSVTVWDPWTVLGVSESATRAQVRSAYRKLSLTEHPDKVAFELRQAAEAKFVEISKAYKVLTDDKARENFEKYGNPDGPMGTTFGIALPPWLFNPKIVLLGYMSLLILLPTAIGYWWYSTKRYTNQGTQVYLLRHLVILAINVNASA